MVLPLGGEFNNLANLAVLYPLYHFYHFTDFTNLPILPSYRSRRGDACLGDFLIYRHSWVYFRRYNACEVVDHTGFNIPPTVLIYRL